jgi:copper chaperone CopZ
MEHKYKIEGMTCQGCRKSVHDSLKDIDGVEAVDVLLEEGSATIKMKSHIDLDKLKAALANKYAISEFNSRPVSSNADQTMSLNNKTKWQQLKPLFLILFYIGSASILIHYNDFRISAVMLDFMGLFYIVFSFFKMLDLKGFPESFRMYDPLAKALPFYGKIYPFVETVLGLMFLFRFELTIALILTLLILGATTYGVARTLLDKKSIRCACLGTALNLPMTEATLIENGIMIVMAVSMLFMIL